MYGHLQISQRNNWQRSGLLDPGKYNGHTFRCSVEGWGVIHIQIKILDSVMADSTISINLQKRAEAWSGRFQTSGSPSFGTGLRLSCMLRGSRSHWNELPNKALQPTPLHGTAALSR